MVKLKANFESDLIAHARRTLTAQYGSEVNEIEDKDVMIHFFDSLRRQIAIRPRDIKIAADFRCPPGRENDWKAFQEKVCKGEDLGPHLSKLHESLFNVDGLLNEWGVHHFHIGTQPDHKNPYYVKRDGPLVFALVDESTFYAINVYNHGEWEQLSIIESLHKHWPNVISKYRLRGIPGETLNEKQRRTIRNPGGQAAVATQDGTVYGSIGGVTSSAGNTLNSVEYADMCLRDIRQLQSGFEAALCQVLPALERAGYAGEQELEAELQVTECGFNVFFPRYGVRAANLKVIWTAAART